MRKQNFVLAKVGFVAAVLALTIISCTTEDPLGPTDARDKYIGTWGCTETEVGTSSTLTFNVIITKNTADSTRIFLANVSSIGTSYKPQGVVSGNSFSIPSYNAQGYTVSGSGTYSSASGKINMTYSVNDGTIKNYTAVLSK